MIIFLYGEDSFRSRQKLKQLREKFIREVDKSGASLTVLDGRTITIGQFSESVGSATLLAKKRMVIIEDIFLAKELTVLEKICSYLKDKKLDEHILIFWDHTIKTKKVRNKEVTMKIDAAGREKPLTKSQSQLFKFLTKPSFAKASVSADSRRPKPMASDEATADKSEGKPSSAKATEGKPDQTIRTGKQKYTQQFHQLSNTETTAWAKKEVANRGGKITYQAVQLLTSLVGSDLWQINNEINKLINYKLGREPQITAGNEKISIEVEDVELLVRSNFDENIFALTDAISNRDKAQAVKLLEEQIEAGLTDSYLVNMIVRQFRILLQIRQGLDSGMSSRKMTSSLKLHPFIIQKGINQVRRFNLQTLKNILGELVKLDFKMKTGQADARTMLNILIVKT